MLGTASGLIAVIVFQLLVPSESRQCERSPQTEYGCSFDQLTSSDTWCEADSYNNLPFSFYIKPGNHFNGLAFVMTAILGGTGRFRRFKVQRNWLPQADKWYHIQLSENTGVLGANTAYHLSIDGYQKFAITPLLTAPEKFTVVINGSPFYTRAGCNPGNFSPFPPKPTNPPPSLTTVPPRHTLLRTVVVTKTLSPIPEETTESDIVTPKYHSHVTDNTENGSSENSVMVDSSISHGSSDSSGRSQRLSQPWWVFVLIGVGLMNVIAAIITTTVMVKKCKGKKDDKRENNEENGLNNQDSPPLHTDEFDNPANHVYDELDDPTNHVYEELEVFDDSANHIYEEPKDFNDLANHIYEEPKDFNDPANHTYEEPKDFQDPANHIYLVLDNEEPNYANVNT